ncbi:hypothetical protein FALCPG4_015773 [Fusarium falciforme]
MSDTDLYFSIEDRWKESRGDPSDHLVAKAFDQLKEATLRLFMSLLHHHAKDSEHDYLMVSFLTSLSIAPDGTRHSFDTFTPWLSAIVAVSRLLILKEAHLIRCKAIEEKVSGGLRESPLLETLPLAPSSWLSIVHHNACSAARQGQKPHCRISSPGPTTAAACNAAATA